MWLASCAHKKVDYQGLHARQGRNAALLHTNGGGSSRGSLYGWWEAGAKGQHGAGNLHIGAQFQVKYRGRPEQYVDADMVVYHAYGASEWAVGIETEDDSNPLHKWNDHQLEGIVAILHELHVPARKLTSSAPGDGVGWHEQFQAWNQSGHVCPDHVREHQIIHEVIPELAKLRGEKPPVIKPGKPVRRADLPQWFHRALVFPVAQHPGKTRRLGGVLYQDGNDVATVQCLVAVPKSERDGLYGPLTAHHVRAFQHDHHLSIDGIVGKQTAAALAKK